MAFIIAIGFMKPGGSVSLIAGIDGGGIREAGVGTLLLTTVGLTIGNVAGLLNNLFTCLTSGRFTTVAATPAGADAPVPVAARGLIVTEVPDGAAAPEGGALVGAPLAAGDGLPVAAAFALQTQA